MSKALKTNLKGKTFVTTDEHSSLKVKVDLVKQQVDNHIQNHPTLEDLDNFYSKEEIDDMLENFEGGSSGDDEESTNFQKDWGTIAPTDLNKIEVSQIKGTTSQLSKYAGVRGQIVVNTDKNTIHVMNGSTVGGIALATENFVRNNIPEMDMTNIYSKSEIDTMLGDLPNSLAKVDQLLAKLLGCDHKKEVELIDSINGEVI